MASPVAIPNGLGWSPDRKTMYHADTTSHRVDCYDFDVAAGTVGNRRNLVTFEADKTSGTYGGLYQFDTHTLGGKKILSATFDALDREIRSVFPDNELVLPDQVRGFRARREPRPSR